MEKIEKYIEKLLAQHDFVIVPNFGGFVVQYQSAVIHPDKITPPHSTVGFNPLMNHSDGLLAIEISRGEGVSYRIAMQLLEKEVESLKEKLTTDTSLQIGNLGTLKCNSQGTIEFQPTAFAHFLPQNFGQKDIYLHRHTTTVLAKETKTTRMLPSRSIFKYAAACLLLSGLLLSPQVNDARRAELAGIIPICTTLTAPIQNTIDTVDTVKTANSSVASSPVLAVEKSFHVIVASLPTKISAEKFCTELKSKSFETAHVLEPSKTYRIAIKSFNDKDSAITYMENLRLSDSQFETAWVYCD